MEKIIHCFYQVLDFIHLAYGAVFGVGSNKDGKLGIGKQTISLTKPQLIEFPPQTQIKQTSCGWGHSLALDTTGTVFSWGYGKNGALGQGSFSNCYKPSKIYISDHRTVSIKCGSQHSGFLTENGKVLMCGANHNGQLGIGSREDKPVATLTKGIEEPIEQIALGVTHSLMLTRNGEVYATGGNSFGQLGLGHKQIMEIPQRVNEFDGARIQKIGCGQHSGAITVGGELYLWGTGTFGMYLTPHKVTSNDTNKPFIDFSIGGSFGLALDSNHNLWTWGTNTSGELGNNSYMPKSTPAMMEEKEIAQVYCGSAYVFAIPKKYKSSFRASPMLGYLKVPGQFQSKEISEERFSDVNSKDNSKFSSPYNKDEPIISTIKGEKNYYEEESMKRYTKEKPEIDLRAALKELSEAKLEIDNLRKERDVKNERISVLEKEKHELKMKLNDLESKFDQDSDAFIRVQLRLNDKEIELKAIKTEADLAKQNFNSLRADYNNLLETLQHERQNSIQALENVEMMEREVQKISKTQTTLESRNVELEKLNNEKDIEYFFILSID